MFRSAFLFFISIILLSSCAARYKTITGIRDWSYPQNQFDKQFSFSYFDNVLKETNNKRAARWAKRKNIHVIGIKLINNGEKPIHGTQLSFYNGDERAEIIHNQWLAKKVRQRISPLMIVVLPALLVEDAIFHRNGDTDEFNTRSFENDPHYFTEDIANQEEKRRKDANFSLKDELMKFQLANQVLIPNKAVYGVIGIRCKGELKDLRVVKNDSDFSIILKP
ncbi:hypothetical protein ACUNWD_07455 [Sunxiuqinia sp. A32]|uniref:hypothetical protein n=1 Tax=Sunxiuqinia sp. A32 TaxID=3461496 RepID=UPI004045E28B